MITPVVLGMDMYAPTSGDLDEWHSMNCAARDWYARVVGVAPKVAAARSQMTSATPSGSNIYPPTASQCLDIARGQFPDIIPSIVAIGVPQAGGWGSPQGCVVAEAVARYWASGVFPRSQLWLLLHEWGHVAGLPHPYGVWSRADTIMGYASTAPFEAGDDVGFTEQELAVIRANTLWEVPMPNVIDYPAAPTNYGGYGRFNTPRAIVLHTPEEKPDAYESTPVWFANPAAQASTQIYISDNGDIYRMVADEQPSWACGTNSVNRHWKGNYGAYAPWGEPGLSNNVLTLNIEIEGYAASLNMPEAQYQSLLWQCREWVTKYNVPIDSDHICGHGDLATDRSDPGAGLPWERLFADLGAPITAPPPATVPANEAGWVQVSQAELVEVLNNAAAGSLGAAIAGSGGVTYLVRKTPSGDKWDFVIHNIPLTAAPDLDALK